MHCSRCNKMTQDRCIPLAKQYSHHSKECLFCNLVSTLRISSIFSLLRLYTNSKSHVNEICGCNLVFFIPKLHTHFKIQFKIETSQTKDGE
jgi:hypothetical protein